MTFEHAYALEVVQTVIAALVALMIALGWRNAQIDLSCQRIYGTSASVILAKGHVQRQIWRMVLGGIILYIGVWSVLRPPPPESGHFWDIGQVTVGRILFMLGTISHGGASVADLIARRRVEDLLEADGIVKP